MTAILLAGEHSTAYPDEIIRAIKDKGLETATPDGENLTPDRQYLHEASTADREIVRALDIGAQEHS